MRGYRFSALLLALALAACDDGAVDDVADTSGPFDPGDVAITVGQDAATVATDATIAPSDGTATAPTDAATDPTDGESTGIADTAAATDTVPDGIVGDTVVADTVADTFVAPSDATTPQDATSAQDTAVAPDTAVTQDTASPPDATGPTCPAPPAPPGLDPFAVVWRCPAGHVYDAVYRLCVSGAGASETARGPFTEAMVAACEACGGASCGGTEWPADQARGLRGLAACPPGATRDGASGLCLTASHAWGPFRAREVDACVAGGGGQACGSMRWSRSFAIAIAGAAVPDDAGGGAWVWPVAVDHGLRQDAGGGGHFGAARAGNPGGHSGLDLLAPIGTTLRAPCAGSADSGYDGGFGWWVRVVCEVPDSVDGDAGAWASILMAHLSSVAIPASATVSAGQTLGAVGKTGNAGGASILPHVHFEVTVHPSRAAARAELHSSADHSANGVTAAFQAAITSRCWTPTGLNALTGPRSKGRRPDPYMLLACLVGDKPAPRPSALQSAFDPWSRHYAAGGLDVDGATLAASEASLLGVASVIEAAANGAPYWASFIAVDMGSGTPAFAHVDVGDTARRVDFWPASVIKLYVVTAALELIAANGATLDATAAFYREGPDGGWVHDVSLDLRTLVHGVFDCSSNEYYTLLLRLAGVDWLNGSFFTTGRGFSQTALMRGYTLERPWRYVLEERQRIVVSGGGGASFERVHAWSGASWADAAGCEVYNEMGTANCSSTADMTEHLRRLMFHEYLPPGLRFAVRQSDLDWTRFGGSGLSNLNLRGCETGAWSGVSAALPGASFFHKAGLVTDYALDLHYVSDPGTGTRYLLAIGVEAPTPASGVNPTLRAISEAVARHAVATAGWSTEP